MNYLQYSCTLIWSLQDFCMKIHFLQGPSRQHLSKICTIFVGLDCLKLLHVLWKHAENCLHETWKIQPRNRKCLQNFAKIVCHLEIDIFLSGQTLKSNFIPIHEKKYIVQFSPLLPTGIDISSAVYTSEIALEKSIKPINYKPLSFDCNKQFEHGEFCSFQIL